MNVVWFHLQGVVSVTNRVCLSDTESMVGETYIIWLKLAYHDGC